MVKIGTGTNYQTENICNHKSESKFSDLSKLEMAAFIITLPLQIMGCSSEGCCNKGKVPFGDKMVSQAERAELINLASLKDSNKKTFSNTEANKLFEIYKNQEFKLAETKTALLADTAKVKDRELTKDQVPFGEVMVEEDIREQLLGAAATINKNSADLTSDELEKAISITNTYAKTNNKATLDWKDAIAIAEKIKEPKKTEITGNKKIVENDDEKTATPEAYKQYIVTYNKNKSLLSNKLLLPNKILKMDVAGSKEIYPKSISIFKKIRSDIMLALEELPKNASAKELKNREALIRSLSKTIAQRINDGSKVFNKEDKEANE